MFAIRETYKKEGGELADCEITWITCERCITKFPKGKDSFKITGDKRVLTCGCGAEISAKIEESSEQITVNVSISHPLK